MLCCKAASCFSMVNGGKTRVKKNFSFAAKRIQTTRRRSRHRRVSEPVITPSSTIDISHDEADIKSSTCEDNHDCVCFSKVSTLPHPIDVLPDELLLKIAGFLCPLSKAFARFRGTCRRFRDILQTKSLYRTTRIDISDNRPFDFDILNLTVSCSEATLTEVNLSRCNDVTDYVIYQLASKCRQIVAVDLSHCACLTNVGLRVLANLVMLRRIDISGCPKITGRGLHLMVKLNGDSLEEAAINGCVGMRSDSNNMLHFSKYCSKLTRLEMAWDARLTLLNPLAGIDMNRFTKHLSGLVFLDISGSACTDEGLLSLSMNCRRLQTIKLRHCIIHDDGLKHVSEWLQNLSHLDVSNCLNITDAGLEFVGQGCPLLRHVDISGSFYIIGDGLFTLVNNCTQLHTLIARECFDLTEDTIVFISVLCPHLRHFDVSFNYAITDETLMTISVDREYEEELTVVTEGCPNVTINSHGVEDDPNARSGGSHRFRFVDWKGVESSIFVIWETAV